MSDYPGSTVGPNTSEPGDQHSVTHPNEASPLEQAVGGLERLDLNSTLPSTTPAAAGKVQIALLIWPKTPLDEEWIRIIEESESMKVLAGGFEICRDKTALLRANYNALVHALLRQATRKEMQRNGQATLLYFKEKVRVAKKRVSTQLSRWESRGWNILANRMGCKAEDLKPIG